MASKIVCKAMVSDGILKSGTIIRESTTGEKNLIGASKGKIRVCGVFWENTKIKAALE